jgi:hypothetical protein
VGFLAQRRHAASRHITGWLALETRKMREGSDKAIGELSKHAASAATASAASSESAKASAAALQSSVRLAQNGQRAWIFVSAIGRPPNEHLTMLGATVTFRNGGPTPATHFWVESYLREFREFPGRSAVPPG